MAARADAPVLIDDIISSGRTLVAAPGVETIALDTNLAQGVLDLCSGGCSQPSPSFISGARP